MQPLTYTSQFKYRLCSAYPSYLTLSQLHKRLPSKLLLPGSPNGHFLSNLEIKHRKDIKRIEEDSIYCPSRSYSRPIGPIGQFLYPSSTPLKWITKNSNYLDISFEKSYLHSLCRHTKHPTTLSNLQFKQNQNPSFLSIKISSPVPHLHSFLYKKLTDLKISQSPQYRSFAGRSGGMKRKKSRHSPRIIQTGKGRRLEFFWPKKHRRLRVPLYQNSRRHLIYDTHLKKWLVMWYRNGMQVFESFSTNPRTKNDCGFEIARKRALILLKHLKHLKIHKRVPPVDMNKSGVRGVYFDYDERLWVAVWNEAGVRQFKSFSVLKMGFDEAFQAAVAVRRQKLFENSQFVMIRSRWRGGRIPLK